MDSSVGACSRSERARRCPGVRRQVNADGTTTYSIDLPQALAGTPVMLSFDLLGFGAAQGSVTLRDIHLSSEQLQANPDAALLAEDLTATGNLLTNDVAVGSVISQVQLVDAPAHGAVTLANDGSFSYQPVADYFGADAFSYRLLDSLGRTSNTASVTLTITPVNDASVDRHASVSRSQKGANGGLL